MVAAANGLLLAAEGCVAGVADAMRELAIDKNQPSDDSLGPLTLNE